MVQTVESEIKYCKSEILLDTKVIDMDAEEMFQMGQKPLWRQKAFSEEHDYWIQTLFPTE